MMNTRNRHGTDIFLFEAALEKCIACNGISPFHEEKLYKLGYHSIKAETTTEDLTTHWQENSGIFANKSKKEKK